jgi:hypothetical protein
MKPVSKEEAEVLILEHFLIAYQKRFNVKLTNIIHRDKPDFDVTNPITKEHIGIEVTGSYQNEREAIIQYGDIDDGELFVGSIEELLTSLNNRLNDKAEKSKTYKFNGRIFLVIWLGSLVFNQKFDVDFIRHKLFIPQNRFSEIWLIIRDKDDYSPELYPLQT